jgi:hypothetical protein
VTVRFTCKAHGGKLLGGCPRPLRITHSGKGLQVHMSVANTTGQRASVVVRGINIDLTKPHVRIFGPMESSTYSFAAPRARCHASDAYSGIRSCVLYVRRVPTAGGYKLLIGARAVAGSGVVGKAGRLSFVTNINVSGGSLINTDYWSVTPGHSYVLQVMQRAKPTYLDAAPGTVSPTGPYDYFTRTGTVDGIPIWSVSLDINQGFAHFGSWTVGIQTGSSVRRIKLEMLSN